VGSKDLKSHRILLEQFEFALNHEWPPDDEARLMGIIQPNYVLHYSRSSSKQTMSTVGAEGGFDKVESASKQHAGER
jgi:hypothetical protein